MVLTGQASQQVSTLLANAWILGCEQPHELGERPEREDPARWADAFGTDAFPVLRGTRGARLLRAMGDETPWDDIRQFCGYLGIEPREYFDIVEGFRNRDLWTRRDDRWQIDGFLVQDFPWPADPDPELMA